MFVTLVHIQSVNNLSIRIKQAHRALTATDSCSNKAVKPPYEASTALASHSIIGPYILLNDRYRFLLNKGC